LRASYGQEGSESRFKYESVGRRSVARVGSNNRIQEVEVINTARSRIDGLDFVRVYIHLPEVEYLEDFIVEPLGDLPYPEVVPQGDASFRVTFTLREKLSIGQELDWGFVRRYRYKRGAPPLSEDRLTVSAKNGGFSIDLKVIFESALPTHVWNFEDSRYRIPGEPTPDNLLMPNESNAVTLSRVSDVQARWCYGIAWRW